MAYRRFRGATAAIVFVITLLTPTWGAAFGGVHADADLAGTAATIHRLVPSVPDVPVAKVLPTSVEPTDLLHAALLSLSRPYYAHLPSAGVPGWAPTYAWQLIGLQNPVLDPGFSLDAAGWDLTGARVIDRELEIAANGRAVHAFPGATTPDPGVAAGSTNAGVVVALHHVAFIARGGGTVSISLVDDAGTIVPTQPVAVVAGVNIVPLAAFVPGAMGPAEGATLMHVRFDADTTTDLFIDDVVVAAGVGLSRLSLSADKPGAPDGRQFLESLPGGVGDAYVATDVAHDGVGVITMPTGTNSLFAGLVEYGPSGPRLLRLQESGSSIGGTIAPAGPPVAVASTAYGALFAAAGLAGDVLRFDGILSPTATVTLAAAEPSVYGFTLAGKGELNLLKLLDPSNPVNDALDAIPNPVQAAPGAFAFQDTDADGFADLVEVTFGSSTTDPLDVPGRDPGVAKAPTAAALRAAGAAKVKAIQYPLATLPAFMTATEQIALELVTEATTAPTSVAVRLTPSFGALAGAYTIDATVVSVGAAAAPSATWPTGGRDAFVVTVALPAGLPAAAFDRLYDVNVTWDGGADTQPRSVQLVSAYTATPRIAVIADPQVGDPRALQNAFDESQTARTPEPFVRMLTNYTGDPVALNDEWLPFRVAIDEINLHRPDFVIVAGDLGFGQLLPGTYHVEFEHAYDILNGLEVPVFLSVGNHDGYATNAEDGYAFWEAYFGPLYYSFDYGTVHGIATNTYDWPYVDRLGMGTATSTWGGQIRPQQFAWLQNDLAAHAGATYSFAFGHHSPSWQYDYWRGSEAEDMLKFPGYGTSMDQEGFLEWWTYFFGGFEQYAPTVLKFPFRGAAASTYLTSSDTKTGDQKWTGVNRLETRDLLRASGVDAFFAGHTHIDRVAQELLDPSTGTGGDVIEATGDAIRTYTRTADLNEFTTAAVTDFDFRDASRVLYVETTTPASGTGEFWGYRLHALGVTECGQSADHEACFGYHPTEAGLTALRVDTARWHSHQGEAGLFSLPSGHLKLVDVADVGSGERLVTVTNGLEEPMPVTVAVNVPEAAGGVTIVRAPRGGVDHSPALIDALVEGATREVRVRLTAPVGFPGANTTTQALVYVDAQPPSTSLEALPAWSTLAGVTLNVTNAVDDHDFVSTDLESRVTVSGTTTAWAVIPGCSGLSATGSCSYVFPSVGNYEFRSRGIDLAGHREPATKAADATTGIDVLAPTLTGTVVPATPDGLNGWYTTAPTVTLTVTDDVSGVDAIGFELAPGSWQAYTAPFTLPDGTHQMAWRATDNAGNLQRVTAGTYKVDATDPLPPDVGFEDPDGSSTDPANLTNGRIIDTILRAAGVDNSSSVFYGITTVASPPAPASSDWSATLPATFTLPDADGAHTLRVFVRDEAGNIAGPATHTITLDRVAPAAPTLTLTDPVTGATSSLRSATADLAVTHPATSDVHRWFFSTSATTPSLTDAGWVATPPATFTFTGDGTHTLNAWVRDAAGNVLAAPATVTVVVDTQAPSDVLTLTLKDPARGDTVRTSSRTVDVAFTGGSGATHYFLTVDDATTPAWNAAGWSASAPTQTSLGAAAADGTYTARLWVKDAAGNVNTNPATATITLDSTPPTAPAVRVSDQAPLAVTPATLTNARTIDLIVDTAGADSVGAVEYAVGINGGAAGAWTSTLPATVTLPDADGAHTVNVHTRDLAGNLAPVASVSITLDRAAPAAPVLTLTDPTTGSTVWTLERTVDVTGAHTNAADVHAWLLTTSATAPAEDDAAFAAATPATVTLSAGDGAKTLYLWVRDAAGNVQAVAGQATITLDQAAPAAPATFTVTDAATASGAWTNGASGLTLAIAPVTDAAAYFVARDDATVPTRTATGWLTAAPSTWTLPASAPDGVTTFYVFVKDAAGNVQATPATATIDIDRAVPAATLQPLTDTLVTASALSIDVTTTDAHGTVDDVTVWVRSRDRASTWTPWTVAASGVTTPFTFTAPTGGTYQFEAVATDAARNVESRASVAEVEVTVDTAAPTITSFSAPVAKQGDPLTLTFAVLEPETAVTALVAFVADTGQAENVTATRQAGVGTPDTFTATFTVPSAARGVTFSITATDAADRVTTKAGTATIADITPPGAPVVTHDPAAGAAAGATRDRTVAVTAAPGTPDDVAAWLVTTGAATPAAADPAWTAKPPTSVTLPDADGVHTMSVWVRDPAGNLAVTRLDVTLDRVAPVMGTYAGDVLMRTNYPFQPPLVNATDALSGVVGGAYWFPGTVADPDDAARFIFRLRGTFDAYMNATDAAGNTASTKFTFTVHTPPAPPPAKDAKVVVAPPPPPPEPAPVPLEPEGNTTDEGGASLPPPPPVQPTRTGPGAAFTVTPRLPEVGDVLRLDATGSLGPGGPITGYIWQIGGLERRGVVATLELTEAGRLDIVLVVTAANARAEALRVVSVQPRSTPADVMPPTVDATVPSGVQSAPFTLRFLTESGATVHWRVNGGPEQTGSEAVLTGDGPVSVTFFGSDAAGNRGAPRTVTVTLDGAAPRVTDVAFEAVTAKRFTPVAVHARVTDPALETVHAVITDPSGTEETRFALRLSADGLHRGVFRPVSIGSYQLHVVAIDRFNQQTTLQAAAPLAVTEPLEPAAAPAPGTPAATPTSTAPDPSGVNGGTTESTPARPTPVPAAAFVLVALAGVALALRQRRGD